MSRTSEEIHSLSSALKDHRSHHDVGQDGNHPKQHDQCIGAHVTVLNSPANPAKACISQANPPEILSIMPRSTGCSQETGRSMVRPDDHRVIELITPTIWPPCLSKIPRPLPAGRPEFGLQDLACAHKPVGQEQPASATPSEISAVISENRPGVMPSRVCSSQCSSPTAREVERTAHDRKDRQDNQRHGDRGGLSTAAPAARVRAVPKKTISSWRPM